MKQFKWNPLPLFVSLMIAVSLITLIVGFSSCKNDDDCTSMEITSVRSTILQAFQDPSGFDDYVANNQDVFDGNFYACIDQTVDQLSKVSNERKDECDDAFVTGGDFWNQCYNDVEVEVDNSIVMLNDIRRVTQGQASFEETSTGLSLIFLQLSDPAEYNSFVNIINQIFDELEGEGGCTLCV